MNDSSNRDLYASFVRATQAASEVGGNPIFDHLARPIQEIDQVDDQFLRRCRSRLSKQLELSNMGLDARLTREFVQDLGEAHFYALCKAREIDLTRVPGADHETPDFVTDTGPAEFFEIKTPCFLGGERPITNLLEESFEGRIDIQQQLDAGQTVGSSTQVIQPYGAIERGRQLTRLIEILQAKLRQNLHQGQFSSSPTYLVCSLLMLPTYGDTTQIIRPVYCRRDLHNHLQPMTGELWMVAFSQSGMLIQSAPEFEGKPSVEGRVESVGILADALCGYVAGIIFVVYDLGGRSRPLALLRSRDELTDTVIKLVGSNWNDKEDCNGWAFGEADDDLIVVADEAPHDRADTA